MTFTLQKWEMRNYRVDVSSMSLSIATNTERAGYPIRTSMSALATVENTEVYVSTQTSATLPIEGTPNPTQSTVVLVRTHIHTTVPTTQTSSWKLPFTAHPWSLTTTWTSSSHVIFHPCNTSGTILVQDVWCWFSLHWDQNQQSKKCCNYLHLQCVIIRWWLRFMKVYLYISITLGGGALK